VLVAVRLRCHHPHQPRKFLPQPH